MVVVVLMMEGHPGLLVSALLGAGVPRAGGGAVVAGIAGLRAVPILGPAPTTSSGLFLVMKLSRLLLWRQALVVESHSRFNVRNGIDFGPPGVLPAEGGVVHATPTSSSPKDASSVRRPIDGTSHLPGARELALVRVRGGGGGLKDTPTSTVTTPTCGRVWCRVEHEHLRGVDQDVVERVLASELATAAKGKVEGVEKWWGEDH